MQSHAHVSIFFHMHTCEHTTLYMLYTHNLIYKHGIIFELGLFNCQA